MSSTPHPDPFPEEEGEGRRDVTVPRPASTVMLVRPGPDTATPACEVFMVRRPLKSAFAADVYVFPGGAVRPDDLDPAVDDVCAPFTAQDALHRLGERGGQPPEDARAALGLWVAAIRELFEEAGVLLAEAPVPHANVRRRGTFSQRLGRERFAVQSGSLSLAELARSEGMRLACEQLVYFSHWVTPLGMSRRFDTRFFLAAMPPEQEALHCNVETVDGAWVTPAAALAASDRGELPLMFPTRRHLERMADFPTLDGLLDFARTKRIASVLSTVHHDPNHPETIEEPPPCW